MPAAINGISSPRGRPLRCLGQPRTRPQACAGTLGACVLPESELPEIARNSRTPPGFDTPIDPDERRPREAPSLALVPGAPCRSEISTIELSAERLSPLQALAFEFCAPARARELPRSHPTPCPLTSRQRSNINLSLRPWSMRPWESAWAAATGHGFARSHRPPEQRVNGAAVNFRLTLRCAAAPDGDPLFGFLRCTRCNALRCTRCKAGHHGSARAPARALPSREGGPPPSGGGRSARERRVTRNRPRTMACRGHHRAAVRGPHRRVGRRCPPAAARCRHSALAWRRHSTAARCGRATLPRPQTCG
jgi:hypothetical protein